MNRSGKSTIYSMVAETLDILILICYRFLIFFLSLASMYSVVAYRCLHRYGRNSGLVILGIPPLELYILEDPLR